MIIKDLLDQSRLIQLLWRRCGCFMLLLWWSPFKMKKGKWPTRQFQIIYPLVPLSTPVTCRWTVPLNPSLSIKRAPLKGSILFGLCWGLGRGGLSDHLHPWDCGGHSAGPSAGTSFRLPGIPNSNSVQENSCTFLSKIFVLFNRLKHCIVGIKCQKNIIFPIMGYNTIKVTYTCTFLVVGYNVQKTQIHFICLPVPL